jgi:hypothetical protein
MPTSYPPGAKEHAAADKQALQQASKPGGAVVSPVIEQAVKRPKHGTAADGMQYFLQLQRGKQIPQPADGSATPNTGPERTSSSSEDMADALELHSRQRSETVHTIELPAVHAELLRLLAEDEKALVRTTPGVAPAVARSDFLAVEALQRALEQVEGWLKLPAACRGLPRPFSSMSSLWNTSTMMLAMQAGLASATC